MEAIVAAITAVGIVLAATLPPLVQMNRRSKVVHAEVTHNGGASMKDNLLRVANWCEEHGRRDDLFEQYVHERFHGIANQIHVLAGRYETNHPPDAE